MRNCSLLAVLILAACAQTPAQAPAKATEIPVTAATDEALAHYAAAREYAALMHTEEARSEYRAAVEADPDFATAWLGLALVATSREEGERNLDRAVALADKATEAERLRILAARAAWDGDPGKERELLTILVTEHCPDSAEANYALGVSYWSSDAPSSLRYLERAVELDPGYHPAWNILGYVYAGQGRSDDAVRAHRHYVELIPGEPNAHDSLAETLLRAGRFNESRAEYEKALALDPGFLSSRIGIGHDLLFLGRYADARAAYEEALAKAATKGESYLANTWIVVLGIYAKDPELALSAAERGIRLGAALGDYEAASAVLTLARVQLWRGEFDTARDTAGRALARLGESASDALRHEITFGVLRFLCEVDLAEGNEGAATSRLEDLSRTKTNVWEARLIAFLEGRIALAAGRPEGALAALADADEHDPRVLYYRGVANEELRKTEEAAADYEEVVRLFAPSLGHALVLAPARARLSVLRFR